MMTDIEIAQKASVKPITEIAENLGIAEKYIEFSYEHYKTIGLGTPDPITIASVIDPNIVKFEPCSAEIIIEGEKKGECNIKLTDTSNIYVSTDFDLELFRKLFCKTFN